MATNNKKAIEASLSIGSKKNKAERVAPSAKLKLEEITARVFRHNLSSGGYSIVFDNLNDKLSNLREEIKEKEEETAEKEAKFDEKMNGEGINELNQNLLLQKLKRTISRSTSPDIVVPILEAKKMMLVDDRYFNYGQGSVKPKPIMVAAILKEVISEIGSKPKTYSKQQPKEVEEVEAEKQDVKDVEVKGSRTKKKQNLKWKKFFNGIKTEEEKQEAPKSKKVKEPVALSTNKSVSDGEIRRRKVIGEAGNEIEEIKKLELSVGENEQFNRALINRKQKLIDMLNNLGKINFQDTENMEIQIPNTEFQDLLDEFLHVTEAPSKQLHDKKQQEYDEYYSDPFVIKQLQKQQLEGVLYDYNQPDFYEKIQENERIADKELVEKSINSQEDNVKKINESILQSKDNVLKQEKAEKEKQQLLEDAKSNAMSILLNGLAMEAKEQVLDEYKIQLEKKLEEDKKIKREAEAQALILDFKNWASDAFNEIISAEKGRIANEQFEANIKSMAKENAMAFAINNLAADDIEAMQNKLKAEYDKIKAEYTKKLNEKIEEEQRIKRGAEAQAIILDFQNWSAAALDDIVNSEKNRIQAEQLDKEIKSMASSEANSYMFQNLASSALDETVDYFKKGLLKEKEEKDNLYRDARIEGERLFQRNLVADGVEEVIESYKKDNKDIINKAKRDRSIRIGEKAIRDRKAIISGQEEGKRLFKMDQKKKMSEGAKEEANNLFIKDIKYNAELIAKKLVEDSMTDNKENQVVISENNDKPYSVTDVNNRYLRIYNDSRRIQIDNPHYINLETNSKSKYGLRSNNDYGIVESLMGQLEELGLGESSSNEAQVKLAA